PSISGSAVWRWESGRTHCRLSVAGRADDREETDVLMATVSAERRERIAALDYDYAAQPKQTLTSCNLCGAAEFVILTHRDRYGYPVQAHACRRCGLVFLNPRLTA